MYLSMEFVGKNGSPSKVLLESQIDENDYHQAISIIKNLYTNCKISSW